MGVIIPLFEKVPDSENKMVERTVDTSDTKDLEKPWQALVSYWYTLLSDWFTWIPRTFPIATSFSIILFAIITCYYKSVCVDRVVRKTQTLVRTFRSNTTTES